MMRNKTRADEDWLEYPQSFPQGSLHTLTSDVPAFAKKKRRIGFAIPKAVSRKANITQAQANKAVRSLGRKK